MSKQIGNKDFYSVYDLKNPSVIEYFNEQNYKNYDGWTVYSNFFVHPDGPKISNDLWHVRCREFAHWGTSDWASVETLNSAFFDDSIKFYAYFYFSTWNLLNEFTAIDLQYRRCVAKAFVERWPDNWNNNINVIGFLRTEFRQFVDYIGDNFDYEGQSWIDHQKDFLLAHLDTINSPTEIQLTDPSVVYFPDKNDEIKAAYTCYRTYDGWFGYVFKPYCENPIKKEGDTWMYHDGHGYVPVEYVSKYVESIPNKIYVAQATECTEV